MRSDVVMALRDMGMSPRIAFGLTKRIPYRKGRSGFSVPVSSAVKLRKRLEFFEKYSNAQRWALVMAMRIRVARRARGVGAVGKAFHDLL